MTSGPLVVAPVYDGLCTFEFSIVAEVFGLERPEMGESWYQFASVPVEAGRLRAHGGLTISVDGDASLLEEADLIVVPGWKGTNAPVPKALSRRLRAAWERGARLASICSGAFVLGATGLLDGRRAATHWRYAKSLQKAYPKIDVDANVLYCEEDRIATSAGSAAGIDLMLHIVRTDFGVTAANSVARRLVMPPHRTGGQAQFIERPIPPTDDVRLSSLLGNIRTDLKANWSVDAMARIVSMSPRTFLRKFFELTACSPGQWIVNERLEQAKRLLESTRLSLEGVAEEVGFGSAQALRQHFQTRLGLSPREYRNSFCSPTIR
ncbi:MAG: transcriptional regulator FtrA [Rhodocyclaceae bacterium]|nr:transcriptional regulator FtrA [Rhodocyclaceae bacterium]MCA3026023.1 transcriptional regulator FtrA [Rhodocyclaceae bacterium]MCA3031411.1 transcriptional regulator FtrA [Rhodocyclaceae bacterium]MCA3036480.1 transcriptional regulator FtrA [Rhodocyclaceae bacterium]MCA3040960.1 transcriptional regulator FtrA [Rhodocyclaceae bacterium]